MLIKINDYIINTTYIKCIKPSDIYEGLFKVSLGDDKILFDEGEVKKLLDELKSRGVPFKDVIKD